MVVSTVVENSYRKTAEIVSEISGLTISAQAAWNIVQKAGTNLSKDVTEYAKLSKANLGKGNIDTKILFEENDGIYLKLQGKSRKLHGPSKEMKVGIAYDGVIYQQAKGKKKRRILADKVLDDFNMKETGYRLDNDYIDKDGEREFYMAAGPFKINFNQIKELRDRLQEIIDYVNSVDVDDEVHLFSNALYIREDIMGVENISMSIKEPCDYIFNCIQY